MKLRLVVAERDDRADEISTEFDSEAAAPSVVTIGAVSAAVMFSEAGAIVASPQGELEVPADGAWHEGQIAGFSLRGRIDSGGTS